MPWDLLISALLGLLVLVVTFAAFRLSARAAQAQASAEEVKVDAAAYTRAKELYESAISTVREEAWQVREEADRLRAEVSSLHTEISRLRAANDDLSMQVTRLHREVKELRTASS